ncbi:MAG: cytochrome C peroxidase [Labilithrix sp.]|nr:cytochrome C peroxidase [Labilithrix sp.]
MPAIKRTRASGVFVVLAAAGALAACGGSGTSPKGPSAVAGGKNPPAGPTGAAGCRAPSAAVPMSRDGASSTLALATVDRARVAFVADEDAKAILTFDLDSHKQLAETRLDGTPAQVWIATDGRVFATLRDKSELVALAASRADQPLTRLCSVATPAEPIAIAATPDQSTILVSSGWGQRLAAFEAGSLAAKFEAKLPREPRAVVVADDGKTAFVSHAVGSVVSSVDLVGAKHESREVAMRGFDVHQLRMAKQQRQMFERMKQTNGVNSDMLAAFEAQAKRSEEGRQSCQGFALAKSAAVSGRIFAPQVMVDPGDLEQRPDGYGDEHSHTEAPAVAVIDEAALTPMLSSMTIARDSTPFSRGDARETRAECLLPRAAVVDAKTKSLLVTCYGIDAVVAYDATAANPRLAERRRWTVGSGPSGVAVDSDKHRAIVWSQFDRTLSSFPIGESELVDERTARLDVQKTAAGPLHDKLPAEYALGRILFHAAGDARIASDGRACASCHPDGRDDAITWATPEGPRRSIMLAGRVSPTAPYSWNGDETTLHNHLGNTFDRLSGKGLRSIELDALVTYISQMPAPSPSAGADRTKVDRGRAIFASREAGCASCHAGATFTDGKNHDVGSKHKADRGSSFNTPSLHLVGGTGPYFHDGRYTSLSELLTKSDGTMGRTKHLSTADLDALETYLRTL